MISEDEIVSALQPSSFGFIGDDAAGLLSEKSDTNYVVTKDLLVQGLHFRTYVPAKILRCASWPNAQDLYCKYISSMSFALIFLLLPYLIPSYLAR